MKAITLLCWLMVSTASAETVGSPNLIVSGQTFMPEGKVEMLEVKLLSNTDVIKTEKGLINGVHYQFYYTDGSGTFSGTSGNTGNIREPYESNWSVSCKKDPISDKKTCQMKMKDLWVYVSGNGKTVVSIGAEHFPNSSVIARIDGGAPITSSSSNDGDFPPNASAKIIDGLKRGQSVTTRYMKWPYRTWVDNSWELYGFNETFKYINWAVRNIK